MMEKKAISDTSWGRRYFLKGLISLGISIVLLSLGILERLIRFFSGPRMTPRQEAAILEEREARHKEAAETEALQIERLSSKSILIGKLSELTAKEGKYFVDYHMRPALAFLGKNGLPLLIPAKCTHLGCTVGNTVDDHNQVLCPCHLSLFNIETGQPTRPPAILPLPLIGWVLKDPTGKVVASKSPKGPVQGQTDPAQLKDCTVHIAMEFKEESAA
jgi:Rieske Fe-S protein